MIRDSIVGRPDEIIERYLHETYNSTSIGDRRIRAFAQDQLTGNVTFQDNLLHALLSR